MHHSVVVASTMLMYKMRKLRSHFLSHLYAVMHDARPSLFYLRSCVRSCGTRAELVVCGRAVMPDARPSVFIFARVRPILVMDDFKISKLDRFRFDFLKKI